MGWMNCIFVSSRCDNWGQDWSNDFHMILNMKSLKKYGNFILMKKFDCDILSLIKWNDIYLE